MAFGAGKKSIKQGSGTIAVGYTAGLETVAIDVSTVVMAKTEVMAWIVNEATAANSRFDIAPVLTSTTNMNLYISSNVAGDTNFKYTWQVIEYF